MDVLANEKVLDAKSYLQAHKIQEMVQNLTQGLLVDRPEQPRQYIEKNLQLMRSIRARNQNHVIFTKDNLIALFRCFDNVGRGYITVVQYMEAMNTIGAVKFNAKPSGYGMDRITQETFAEEAMAALRKV